MKNIPVTKEQLENMYKFLKIKDIGKKFNVGRNLVAKWFRFYGIKSKFGPKNINPWKEEPRKLINSIYIIKNTVNDKVYIGQTWNSIEYRFEEHCKINERMYISRAIQKYGKDKFYITLITTSLTQKEADELEIKYIALYDSTNKEKGYNLKSGGSYGKHSEETKRKMKENNGFRKCKHIKLNEKLAKQIRQEYDSGKSVKELSKKYDINVSPIVNNKQWHDENYIPNIRKQIGENTSSAIITNKVAGDIRKDYVNGMRNKELCLKYKLCYSSIKNIIHNISYHDINYIPNVRSKSSETNPNAKLTWSTVNSIRKDYINGLDKNKICKKYSIKNYSYYPIIKNIQWFDENYHPRTKKKYKA